MIHTLGQFRFGRDIVGCPDAVITAPRRSHLLNNPILDRR